MSKEVDLIKYKEALKNDFSKDFNIPLECIVMEDFQSSIGDSLNILPNDEFKQFVESFDFSANEIIKVYYNSDLTDEYMDGELLRISINTPFGRALDRSYADSRRATVERELRLRTHQTLSVEGATQLRYEQIEVEYFGASRPKNMCFDFDNRNISIENLSLYLKDNMKEGEILTVYYNNNNEIQHKNGQYYYFRCYSNMGTVAKYADELEELRRGNGSLILNQDILKARTFAFYQHDIECNHWYDKELKLPYSYHLQLVADIGMMFRHLLPTHLVVRAIQGCYLHDSVEDARLTFNKLRDKFNSDVASDACRLCTNLGGHTREQRAGQWYYDKINESIVSVFVKFCDRIGNMEHGLIHNSSMVKKYANEMDEFLGKLDKFPELDPMRKHLRMLQSKVNFRN